MNKIMMILRVLLSIPKTIYFNFVVFDFKTAILLPIYVDNSISSKGIYKNAITIDCSYKKTFMIKFGIGGSKAIRGKRGIIYVNHKQKGKIIFLGKAKFGTGIVLYNNSGTTIFDDNFSSNKNCFISCDYNVKFGKDVLLGWNINIRDSDGHKIIETSNKKIINNINIGNHVWICSNVDILKGTQIGDNCIIGYRSLVCGLKCEDGKLIAGVPAKIIKNDVNWIK